MPGVAGARIGPKHDFVDYVQDRLASPELNYLSDLGFARYCLNACLGSEAACA